MLTIETMGERSETNDMLTISMLRGNGQSLVFTFHDGGLVIVLLDKDGDVAGRIDRSYEDVVGEAFDALNDTDDDDGDENPKFDYSS